MANIIHIDRTTGAITLTGFSGVVKATAGVLAGGGAHADLASVTADQHHAQAHAIAGADHTAAGLTVGHVLTATGATTFAFQESAGGVTVVADSTERLALSADDGDLCHQLSNGVLYLYTGT